ncbi:guanylate kinase [Desulfofustis limnaeus]|jgi:guanylate kinase|uniref:Guanylate kinase n=1 Tax=Desulfofustis limnaeus TaxID=2740163 RepID=A0ABM7W672_9BACT|nr:guanylate kinase [Desulfofustis limnaeus]MDX9895292.1 guanylate kinase [Desulfofustis sp.]BDD86427.1 guanylate kinase [Desulfofustis limnaeus]
MMIGSLFIVSAPSGTGKTTLLRQVMDKVERLVFSVSHTTRAPRRGEEDGRDYYFVSEERFTSMIKAGAFLEWAQVHDNYYGTAVSPLANRLERGYDVILDIDVQGAAQVRSADKFPCVSVFVAPPDLQELEKRLRGRESDDERTIARRLANARRELERCHEYQYLIVNDRLADAVRMLCGILYAERAKNRRAVDGIVLDERYR